MFGNITQHRIWCCPVFWRASLRTSTAFEVNGLKIGELCAEGGSLCCRCGEEDLHFEPCFKGRGVDTSVIKTWVFIPEGEADRFAKYLWIAQFCRHQCLHSQGTTLGGAIHIEFHVWIQQPPSTTREIWVVGHLNAPFRTTDSQMRQK